MTAPKRCDYIEQADRAMWRQADTHFDPVPLKRVLRRLVRDAVKASYVNDDIFAKNSADRIAKELIP